MEKTATAGDDAAEEEEGKEGAGKFSLSTGAWRTRQRIGEGDENNQTEGNFIFILIRFRREERSIFNGKLLA